jgi:hypothetical protein
LAINAYFGGIKLPWSIHVSMRKLILTYFFLQTSLLTVAQTKIVSLGIFTGITSTYTWDEGILADPRYKTRYDIKLAPVGINYGVDYEGFGFVISPGVFTIGQNYHVVNTVGGHEGTRKINLQYVNLPLALKFHLIDLSFLKVSFIGGGGIGYLLSGKETIEHNNAKYKFPEAVYSVLPADYEVQYDGVIAPKVTNLKMLSKGDFNTLQFFTFVGLRSDWYVSEEFKVSFDIRANYGILESRSDDYLSKLSSYQTLYDIPGKRRDISMLFSIGISRYIEIEKKEKEQKQRAKGKSSKKFSPKRYPWPSPKKSKPKG